MMYIQKGDAPSVLISERKSGVSDYKFLQTTTLNKIRKQLLKEQGYLCAYCMRRICLENMQIEHYIAQHTDNENPDTALSVDYHNMLGVCQGGKGRIYEQQTCDQHRRNVTLAVDPLDQRTIEKIGYKLNGEIFSKDERINHDLDDVLNLNCRESLLMQNRKSALDALMKKISKDNPNRSASRAYLQKMINHYQAGANGQKQEYAGILIWYLKRRMRKARI